MKKNSSKKFILWISLFIVIIIAGVGFSFALFSYVRTSKEGASINSGSIKLGYFENTDGISLINTYPMSDDAATNNLESNSYFDFYVSYRIDDAVLTYEIDIENLSNELEDVISGKYGIVDSSKIKVALFDRDSNTYVVNAKYLSEVEEVAASGSKDGYYLYSRNVTNSEKDDNYRFYLWISDIDSLGNPVSPLSGGANSIDNQVFSAKLNVQAVAKSK